MKEFIEPVLIKAGDFRLRLGETLELPKVDCRVISEDQYQMLIKMSGILINEVKPKALETRIDSEMNFKCPAWERCRNVCNECAYVNGVSPND